MEKARANIEKIKTIQTINDMRVESWLSTPNYMAEFILELVLGMI